MKNIFRLIILSLSILVLAGCNDYVSLFPLYDDSTLATTPSLSGSWKSFEGDSWRFVPDGKRYKLTVIDDEDKPWKFDAGLVELSGRLFLDLSGEDNGITGAPAHIVARIRLFPDPREGNRIEIAWLEKSWMEERLLEEKQMTHLPETNRRTVLTAPTATLQDFFRRHARDEKSFSSSLK
jgi:hypothetical protein